MKKLLKIVGFLLLLFIVVIGGVLIYIKTSLPNVGLAEDLKIETTAERVERGRYLAHSVTACMDCHSTRDWSKFSGPLVEGTLGKGGDRFDHKVGFPGVFYAKNITPKGILRYSDGELVRVITTGVNKEGKAIFPLMPFLNYGQMDKEDIYSIVAYLRSLDPVDNNVPESAADFPMNFIMNTVPRKASFQKKPDSSDQLAYGAYLVNAAGCMECHTRVAKGQIIPELALSGGRDFAFPDGGVVFSSNITSDKETGIGKWTSEQFVSRFKLFEDSTYTLPTVQEGEFNTVMPWTMYGTMKEEDLTAIFAYLQSVEPIANKVTTYAAASAE